MDTSRRRPVPVEALALRARATERTLADPEVANLIGGLVDRLVAALDPLEDPRPGAYLDVFQALAAAVDVAESVSRRRDT